MTRDPVLDELGFQFEPPCYEPIPPSRNLLTSQGTCSGEWMHNITMYDQLRVPTVPAGEYVLGFRWDCESSAQIWQSCADIIITK